MNKRRLIITIDTEEDQWGLFQPAGHSVNNIERIPRLQELFDEFEVRPTYLITFAVANNSRAVSILDKILKRGGCEIGAHCHPWNTPPHEEKTGECNSMLCNLPSSLQFSKLETLHAIIKKNFGIEPTSFRTGRWGYSSEISKHLRRLGYSVDSSITAYTDWRHFCGPDFSEISPTPYRFSSQDTFTPVADGEMAEIPATVDYLYINSALCNRIHKVLIKHPVNKLRLIGLLNWAGFLRKVYLTPELSSSNEMIALAKKIVRSGNPILNMFFHSNSLQAGLNSFVKTSHDETEFTIKIRQFLQFTKDYGFESTTLSESWLHI